MRKLALLLGLWSAGACALPGTGSVDFGETIVPMLDARPAFKKYLLCNFQIVSDPTGTRIGDVAMPHLGGSVTGPYSMWANWQSPTGPVRVTLTLNTSITFFDKRGRPIHGGNYRPAVRFVEKLDSIEVDPPDDGQPESTPGGFKYQASSSLCTGG
jgi:hypothetical protein